VDHIIPHKGDESLFWDPGNRQSLCTNCHNRTKQRMEKSGPAHYHGSATDGSPLDASHPWNANKTE